MTRKGYVEQTWFTFSYSPLRGDGGQVEGMFCACVETTDTVLAERQRIDEAERLRAAVRPRARLHGRVARPRPRLRADQRLLSSARRPPRPGRQADPRGLARGPGSGLLRAARPGLSKRPGVYRPVDDDRAPARARGRGRGEAGRFRLSSRSPTRPGRSAASSSDGYDVTERQRAEEALRESEERFRLIADSAPVPMWVTRLDRSRSFVNRAYVEFLGISYEEAVDFDWRTVIHPDDAPRVLAESHGGRSDAEAVRVGRPLPERRRLALAALDLAAALGPAAASMSASSASPTTSPSSRRRSGASRDERDAGGPGRRAHRRPHRRARTGCRPRSASGCAPRRRCARPRRWRRSASSPAASPTISTIC